MNDRRPLNFICRRPDLDHILEGQFFRDVLFSGLERPLRLIPVEAGQPWPLMDDSLLLILGGGADSNAYLEGCRDAGHANVGVFHMGDELASLDCGFYSRARYVLRNYYFPDRISPDADPPILWVPNGYANGVGPIAPERLPGFTDRQHVMFFSGHVDGREIEVPGRVKMFEVVKEHGLPSVMAATQNFGGGFGRVSYAAHLANSKFALAPAGISDESIRLYDALENGAIPITLKLPYLQTPDAIDHPPFVILNDWDDLPAFIAPFQDDPAPVLMEEWERRRSNVCAWWQTFKRDKAVMVAETIERSFARHARRRD